MSAYFDSLNRRERLPVLTPVPTRQTPQTVQTPRAVAPVRRLTPTEIPTEYAALHEKLMVRSDGKTLKTLVFAGCEGGEGCTRVAREFAEALASSGPNVMLVDADLRTSGLTYSISPGGEDLFELVASGRTLPATPWGKGKLTVVPSATSSPDKERFLRAPELAAWIEAQRNAYDYVLLDAPPLLAFADGTLLGRLCDGVIIVVQAERTKRQSLARGREQLERAGIQVVGAVLNHVRDRVPGFLRPYLSTE